MKNLRISVLAVMALTGAAFAQPAPLAADQAERCATRLSIALVGKSATPAMMTKAAPTDDVDALINSADFQERFARFVNASFNSDPGADSSEDASYHLAKYVLVNNRPWEDMFLGQFKVDFQTAPTAAVPNPPVVVTADPNGLGYFRSMPWLKRYAGNEEAGVKISTAYRIMQNTIGLKLVASTNAPGADVSATGREAAGCRACHYDGWFALDKVANVLSTVKRTTVNGVVQTTFPAPTKGPQTILGGVTVADDKELVTALVKSEAFEFRACRLAFEYLYGRAELTCEGPTFDRCMTEFRTKKTIQSALAVVAKDATYCR